MDQTEAAIDVLARLDPKSVEYRTAVAQLLRRIEPGAYGTALYDAIARLSWNIAFEAVLLRVNRETGKLEVFLRRRADDDTAYPGQWHCPGSVKRPSERWDDVALRLRNDFGNPIRSYERVDDLDWDEERGSFQSTIFLVEVRLTPTEDERHCWFRVDDLPEETVESHRDRIIPMAAMAYAAKHRLGFKVGGKVEFSR